MENLLNLWTSSGLAQIQFGQAFMILIGLGLLFLAIRKGFEPLLLVPIGFGGILANIPGAGLAYSAVENAILAADPALSVELAGAGAEDAAYAIWSSQIRYLGVGAMLIGGIWTLFSLRSSRTIP